MDWAGTPTAHVANDENRRERTRAFAFHSPSVPLRVKIFRLAYLAAVLASPAMAQVVPPHVEQLDLESAKLGEARHVFVVTPASYAGSTTRYPVLLLLDANDQPQFSAAVSNIAFLASRGAVPELIVVGIPNGKDRTRDLTPVATGATKKAFPTAGGATPFVGFLTNEVLPLVRSKYRTLPSTILAGHSFGGLIAVHAAAANPGAFNGIVAMSPSLWWNDTTAVNAYADSIMKSSASLRLFATSGGLEPAINGPMRHFAARLDSAKHPNVAFGHARYPNATHGLTPQPSLIDGLRFVFEPLSLVNPPIVALAHPDSAKVVNAFTAMQRDYAKNARQLGVGTEALPETFVNAFGYQVLQGYKLTRAAVWVFKQNVTAFPDSPNVYDSLGDALLAAGDTTAAKTQFRQSVEVGERTKQPVADETRKKLAALDSATTRK